MLYAPFETEVRLVIKPLLWLPVIPPQRVGLMPGATPSFAGRASFGAQVMIEGDVTMPVGKAHNGD